MGERASGEPSALLARLLDEERSGRRLGDVLADLRREFPEGLVAYLEAKEAEDRARVAAADREHWHRRLSWRLVQMVLLFGVVSLVVFALWGGQRGFEGAIFFVAGGTTYYLFAQTAVAARGRADRRALEAALERARARYRELGGES